MSLPFSKKIYIYNYLSVRFLGKPQSPTLKREMEESWIFEKVRRRSNTVHISQGLWSCSQVEVFDVTQASAGR